VTLGESRDAFGQRRARVEWRTGELERRTLERMSELFASALTSRGIGAAATPAHDGRGWPGDELQGSRGHHTGTTRMSDSPRTGVVDSTCRVHGIANLFVAGSSVFPTSGAGTPTLTIVALALRLADELRSLYRPVRGIDVHT
jgi:choline dehydrogenase-like flavoprotein